MEEFRVLTSEPTKLCLWCKHFEMVMPSCGYSELTPGSDFDMSCTKEHWKFDAMDGTEVEYRGCILTAEICTDYEFNSELRVRTR